MTFKQDLSVPLFFEQLDLSLELTLLDFVIWEEASLKNGVSESDSDSDVVFSDSLFDDEPSFVWELSSSNSESGLVLES